MIHRVDRPPNMFPAKTLYEEFFKNKYYPN